MSFPNLLHIEWWWYLIAFVFSFYYGWRGYMGTLGVLQSPSNINIAIYCVQQFISHFLCSASGFLALYILSHTAEIKGADASIFMIFLSLYSIAGITGILGDLLPQGKFPGK